MPKKKDYKKESKKLLEEEKYRIVKTITDEQTYLSTDNYLAELSKIDKIDTVLSKEEKPKMDGTTKAALIKGAVTVLTVGAILIYENRSVIHSKLAMNLATR